MQGKRKVNIAAMLWASGAEMLNEVPRVDGYSPTWADGCEKDGENPSRNRKKNLDFRRKQMMITKIHKKMSLESVGAVRERERERERIIF